MKGIYLGAYKALHSKYNIIYQDINGKRDLPGDMLDIDLSSYDFIICTPPCNYWSRANWRRDSSEYSQRTAKLLPLMLSRLSHQDKPFIIENVQNAKKFRQLGFFDFPCFVYIIGGHTYWTNILLPGDIEQRFQNKQYISRSARQGGFNVHQVIDTWLSIVCG